MWNDLNLALAGSVLEAIDGIFLVSSASCAFRADSMIGAFIAVGLWIWMSVAIRGGANWARITGTVFFGIATLGVLVELVILADPRVHVHGIAAAAVGFDLINWAIGLCVVIIIWQRTNAYFFRPQTVRRRTLLWRPRPGIPAGGTPPLLGSAACTTDSGTMPTFPHARSCG